MLLHRLHLENFKRFRDEEIVFSDGITGIVGSNGAGKSTIIEAVFFALYGLKKGQGPGSDYIVSAGAGPRESCEVRLDFEVGGEDFSVVRTFRRTKSSTTHHAQLNRGEALLAEGVTAVEQQVVRLLGMSAGDFKTTIYAAQKDLLSLLDDTPGGRRAWVMRMLGIDYLKKESDAILRDREVSSRDQLAAIDYYLKAHSTDDMLEEQALIAREILALQESLAASRKMKAGIEEELGLLYDRRREVEESRRRYDELNTGIQTRRAVSSRLSGEVCGIEDEIGVLQALNAELEALGDAAGLLEETQRSFQVWRDKRERHNRFCEAERRIRSTLEGLEARKVRLEKQLSVLGQDAETHDRLKTKVSRREALIAELSAMKSGEQEYNRLTREIDRCEYQYSTLERRVASVRKDLVAVRAIIEEIGSSDDILVKLDEARQRRGGVADRIAGISANITATVQLCAKTGIHLEEIRKAGQEGSCPTCRRPLGSSFHEVVADLEAQIAALQNHEQDLGTERLALLSELGSTDDEIEELQTLLRRSQDASRSLETLLKDRAGLLTEVDTCLCIREEHALALRKLGYDPAAAAALQSEAESLELSWREFLGAQERLKGRVMAEEEYERIIREESAAHDDLLSLEKALSEIGYEETKYLEAEESLRRAMDMHRRFLTLSAKAEQFPVLRERLAGKKNELHAVEEEIAALFSELQTLAHDPAHAAELEERIEARKATRDGLIGSISKTQAGLEAMEREKTDLAVAIDQNSRREEQCAALAEELALLGTTRNVIADFINYLLNAVRSGIEGELGRILGQITDGRYDNVLIGEDFTVMVEDMGEHYPVTRFSGGEQDDIAIALRIALSRYLAEFHGVHDRTFLIFDEIFGSQDEERRNNLVQALRTQENQFPQIFLISHIPEIQGEFSNTLQVVMESGSASRVREVTM